MADGKMYNVTLVARADPPKGKKRTWWVVGKAWDMPGGGISIELSPAVVLDREIMRTHYLNVFPIDHGRKPDDGGDNVPPF